MKAGIPISALREVVNALPTEDGSGHPLMIRLAALFSKFYGPPYYINEFAILEIGDRQELLLIPDSEDLDFGSDHPNASLIDLVLAFCTYEMQCSEIEDLDFDVHRALLNRMYHAALAAKNLNRQL